MTRVVFMPLLLLAVGCAPQKNDTNDSAYRIVGSDTELNVVQRMAEHYRAKAPQTLINVSGGGSGAGIAALLEGRADIANASRPASPEERAAAAQAGLALRELIIGLDAVAVIINEANSISALSVEALGRMYRGEVDSWSAVGGPDRAITLYGRQSNSGTYEYFRSAVVQGDYALTMLNMNGNAQIVEAVRHDVNGIGYVGVGYVQDYSDRLRVLAIAPSAGATAVSPLNHREVVAGRYSIARPLFQYFTDTLADPLLRFVEFELSAEGQAIVVSEGFHPAGSGAIARSRRTLGAGDGS